MSVREGAGPLLDNPPQPKRRDSPDGESFGYAATLRAANEKGGERKVGRVRGEGIARSGTGTAKRGDSPGGESLDTRRRRSRRQRKMAGSGNGGEGMPGGGTGADECARKAPAKRGLQLVEKPAVAIKPEQVLCVQARPKKGKISK